MEVCGNIPRGVKGSEIATSISEGLARVSLAIEVNGEVWDLITTYYGRCLY